MMHVYQLVPSPEPFNPYGIRKFAPLGSGKPVMCFIDGPCFKIKFVES